MANIDQLMTCPHCGEQFPWTPRNPFPTVDVIARYRGGIVLIERANPPEGWAIPGGFIEYGEDAESAAHRELEEETGLKARNLALFTVRSAPDRDPRFHTLTVVYTADGEGELAADTDAANAEVFSLDDLPDTIAFDHREVLEAYRRSLQPRR